MIRTRVYFYYFFCCFCLFSCIEKEQNKIEDSSSFENITKSQAEWWTSKEKMKLNLVSISPESKGALEQWGEFAALEIVFKEMPKTDRKGLESMSELLLERFKELSESKFPDKLNVPAVHSRIRLVYTYAYKLRGMILDTDTGEEQLKQGVYDLYAKQNELRKRVEDLLEVSIDEDSLIIR